METEKPMKEVAEQWAKAVQKGESPPDFVLPPQHPLWLLIEGVRLLLEKKETLNTEQLSQHLAEQMQALLPPVQQVPPASSGKDTWKERILYLIVALSASLGTVLFLQWGTGQIQLTGKELLYARHLAGQGILEAVADCQPPFELTKGGLCRPTTTMKDGELSLPAWKPIQ